MRGKHGNKNQCDTSLMQNESEKKTGYCSVLHMSIGLGVIHRNNGNTKTQRQNIIINTTVRLSI